MTLNSNTRLSVTLGVVVAAVIALVGTGWRAANALRDIKEELVSIRREVQAIHDDSWTVTDMDRWSRRLEQANRGGPAPVVVPDPREIHP